MSRAVALTGSAGILAGVLFQRPRNVPAEMPALPV
jgi:hypothetical protein